MRRYLKRWYAPEKYFPGLSKEILDHRIGTIYINILYKNYDLKVVKAEDSMSPVSLAKMKRNYYVLMKMSLHFYVPDYHTMLRVLRSVMFQVFTCIKIKMVLETNN
jgi:hypothetical protein